MSEIRRCDVVAACNPTLADGTEITRGEWVICCVLHEWHDLAQLGLMELPLRINLDRCIEAIDVGLAYAFELPSEDEVDQVCEVFAPGGAWEARCAEGAS